MSTTEKARILRKIATSTEYSEDQKTMLREIYAMTPAEGFETLVQSGIYTASGKLAPEYKPAPSKAK